LVAAARTLDSGTSFQALAKAGQALECAFAPFVGEVSGVAQTRGQPHHFPDPIDDDEFAVFVARHDHVEAVGAQVHGGEHLFVVMGRGPETGSFCRTVLTANGWTCLASAQC